MTKILFIYDTVIPTTVCLIKFMKSFAQTYHCGFGEMLSIYVNEEIVIDSDILMCCRGESPLIYDISLCAKKNGKKMIYYLDDDLKDLPDNEFRYPKRKKWLLKCLGLYDVLITSNILIGEEYKEFVQEKRYVVVNTPVSLDEISSLTWFPFHNQSIKIVYAASESHFVFFHEFISPIVKDLLSRFGKKLEFYFIGVHPFLSVGPYSDQIHYVEFMPLEKYDEFMKKSRFQIGLAPLISNHFTERKYFNKFIEYTKYGVCGIYSNCMPYQLVVKDEVNGLFAEATPEDWFRVICKAIESQNACMCYVNNAQEYLRTYHSEMNILNKFAKDVPELLTFHSPRLCYKKIPIRKIKYFVFRFKEITYLCILSLKRYGIKRTLPRIKNWIKRWIFG